MGKGKGGHRHFVMPDDPMAPPVLLFFILQKEDIPELPDDSEVLCINIKNYIGR